MPRRLRPHRQRDKTLDGLFASFAATAVDAASLLDEMLARFPERSAQLFEQVTECERRGDDILHTIRAQLNLRSIDMPERQDALALASSFDDVIDLTEEVADYFGLYGIEAPMEQSQRLSKLLLACTQELQRAVASIAAGGGSTASLHEVHRLENEADRISRDAIAALFGGGVDPMVVIRWKDIYQRLEQAIDACEHVADVLAETIVRRA